MAGDEAVLRVLLEGTGGVSPKSPAGSRPTQPAREQQLRPSRPEPAGRPARRPESLLNTLIDIAAKFRGTLGGIFGPLAGAALDAAKAIRNMQQAAAEEARAVRDRNRPSALPGKPDIGRAPDEARREELRRLVGAQKYVPPGPAQPPPVTRPSFTAEDERRRQVLSGAASLNAQQQAELNELEKRHRASQEPVGPFGARRAEAPAGPFGAPPGPFGAKPSLEIPEAAKPAGRALRRPDLARPNPDERAVPVEDALPMAEGEGAAGGMAGPAAAYLIIIGAAKAFKAGMEQAVAAAGNLAKGLTAPEVSAASFAEGIGGAAKQASNALIFVAPPLGILAGVAGQAAESLGGLMRNLDQMASRYTGFGPGIAQAQAFGVIQHIAGEFRRGQEVGDSLSRYVIARTELQEKFEDVKARFLVQITPAVITAMKLLEQMMPLIEGVAEGVADGAQTLAFILDPVDAIRQYLTSQDIKKPIKIGDGYKHLLDAMKDMQFAKGQGA